MKKSFIILGFVFFAFITTNAQKQLMVHDSIIESGGIHITGLSSGKKIDAFAVTFSNRHKSVAVIWYPWWNLLDGAKIDSLAIIIDGEKQYVPSQYQTYIYLPKSYTSTLQIVVAVDGKDYYSNLYRVWFE